MFPWIHTDSTFPNLISKNLTSPKIGKPKGGNSYPRLFAEYGWDTGRFKLLETSSAPIWLPHFFSIVTYRILHKEGSNQVTVPKISKRVCAMRRFQGHRSASSMQMPNADYIWIFLRGIFRHLEFSQNFTLTMAFFGYFKI